MLTSLRPMLMPNKPHHFIEVEVITIPPRKTLQDYAHSFSTVCKDYKNYSSINQVFDGFLKGYTASIENSLKKFSKVQRSVLTHHHTQDNTIIEAFEKSALHTKNLEEIKQLFLAGISKAQHGNDQTFEGFMIGFNLATSRTLEICGEIVSEMQEKSISAMSAYTSFWEVTSMELMSNQSLNEMTH